MHIGIASTNTTPRYGIHDCSFLTGLFADAIPNQIRPIIYAISSWVGPVMDAMFWRSANLFINWQK